MRGAAGRIHGIAAYTGAIVFWCATLCAGASSSPEMRRSGGVPVSPLCMEWRTEVFVVPGPPAIDEVYEVAVFNGGDEEEHVRHKVVRERSDSYRLHGVAEVHPRMDGTARALVSGVAHAETAVVVYTGQMAASNGGSITTSTGGVVGPRRFKGFRYVQDRRETRGFVEHASHSGGGLTRMECVVIDYDESFSTSMDGRQVSAAAREELRRHAGGGLVAQVQQSTGPGGRFERGEVVVGGKPPAPADSR